MFFREQTRAHTVSTNRLFNIPTTSRSSSGTPLNNFLKSSDRDLYEGYSTLYQAFFLALSETLPLPFGRSVDNVVFVTACGWVEDTVEVVEKVLVVLLSEPDVDDAVDVNDTRFDTKPIVELTVETASPGTAWSSNYIYNWLNFNFER